MKTHASFAASLFILLTLVAPNLASAQEESTSRLAVDEEAPPMRLSDLDMHLNPQLGVSSFQFAGEGSGSSQTKFSGGATVEFGGPARKFETGLIVMQTGAGGASTAGASEQINSSYLTIPMMAKLRVFAMKDQSWYIKVGGLTAFQMATDDRAATLPVDVLGSLGVGARFNFTSKADFIVEATYDRSLMDAILTSPGVNYNQGVLAMIGLSFRI